MTPNDVFCHLLCVLAPRCLFSVRLYLLDYKPTITTQLVQFQVNQWQPQRHFFIHWNTLLICTLQAVQLIFRSKNWFVCHSSGTHRSACSCHSAWHFWVWYAESTGEKTNNCRLECFRWKNKFEEDQHCREAYCIIWVALATVDCLAGH